MNRGYPRCFAIVVVIALLGSSTLRANAQGGVNLSWDACGADGVGQKNFACNTNTGFDVLIGSVALSAASTRVIGDENFLDIQFSTSSISNWWYLCRSVSQAYAADTDYSGSTSCLDPVASYPFGVAGGVGVVSQASNRMRLGILWGVGGDAVELGPGEYFAFKMRLLHNKTVGTGACTGCLSAACIVFNTCNVVHPVGDEPARDVFTTPIARNWVMWQTGTIGVGPYGSSGCPGATPARVPTWGSIKSLYR